MANFSSSVAIIGAGLAGCEAALILAGHGIKVVLYEMRPLGTTPAHKTDHPAELVCSNSFKSEQLSSAHGVLKAELSLLQSPLLELAQKTKIPAGLALAVDREKFSAQVLEQILSHSNIEFKRCELKKPPSEHQYCIIAAGPLVSESLTQWIIQEFSAESLNFYDAIAPIISADSIDMNKAFFASRRNKGGSDYCNCPFNEDEYKIFYDALISSEKVIPHEFEKETFFEACLPIEIIASRDYKTLTFGPMKPVGLIDPRTDKRPFAVCQLRKENEEADAFNMVGFQTRMTFKEQKRVIRLIPGLENAEFLRFGSIHRNTYLNSPSVLSNNLSFVKNSSLFLAGQICGGEGYTESIATGHLAALFAMEKITQKSLTPLSDYTACGSLLKHITKSQNKHFTPSNINFGLFNTLDFAGKKRINKGQKRKLLSERAIFTIRQWIKENTLL